MNTAPGTLLIFGLGYSGRAIARAAVAAGYAVTATTRAGAAPEPGVALVPFSAAGAAIAAATHLIATAAPDEDGDPVLARYRAAIAAAPHLRWLGYLSTTGVYGDAGGAWVDEATPVNPGSARARRRVAAEQAWAALGKPLAIFRLAGIYGPGRSMFDDLRAGQGRRVVKPGHVFGRIHRDDIAQGVCAAMARAATGIFNFADDEPAASADVVVEAARLLGMAPPPPVPYEQAVQGMSPMARSFWAENRKVSAARTKAALGIAWRYPSYREGLAAILREERTQRRDQ
ncbi:SDR family NAD(P)-dependent oxidoreductase [Acidocella sp. KAb 2-4]|uniref:SDR family NAD(P)-dependent oxidoreductase n=1 Tax=Acidocella sp. KAb 2-4 TaxID=2885158 RepID=UPI001D0872AE|nr:SDR family NAD(P)-dependent oxidoreductase [Acidocella sp. KAb 2-4]MCB5943225.1 SDR family NAD(P)-dependent oxidoreductase [Acidocella sp. KAb 2-4]